MTDNTILRENDGKVYTNILDYVCQKCDLSQEDAASKYDGYKDKKKAKMHNLHQNETIELLQEKEAEGEMSEDAYVKNSEFYFAKYDGKPTMAMVEEGRVKAKKRYEKLKVHEKWLVHQALVDQPEEIEQLKKNQEQLGGYIEEWKAKYNKLKEEKDSMAEKSKKEIKQLRKMLSEKSAQGKSETEKAKSPTKRKNSNSEDPEKIEKKRRKNIFDTAPTKPPGNSQGLYVRQHKDSGKPYEELKQDFNRLTDDEKRILKVKHKEENLKYYEEMKKWLEGLSVEDRQAYEESKMHNKGMFQTS